MSMAHLRLTSQHIAMALRPSEMLVLVQYSVSGITPLFARMSKTKAW